MELSEETRTLFYYSYLRQRRSIARFLAQSAPRTRPSFACASARRVCAFALPSLELPPPTTYSDNSTFRPRLSSSFLQPLDSGFACLLLTRSPHSNHITKTRQQRARPLQANTAAMPGPLGTSVEDDRGRSISPLTRRGRMTMARTAATH